MSNLKVNTIEPYSGGSVTITGLATVDTAVSASHAIQADSASLAATATLATQATNLTAGNKTLSGGSIDQQFTAPGAFGAQNFSTVTGATVNGTGYTNVVNFFADYTPYGNMFSDYYAIEYYDGFGYNFGSEFNVNGIQTRLATFASGSGQGAQIKTTDNGDTTAQVTIEAVHVVLPSLGNYADDTAAAAGGVKVNGLYRNGSVVQIRVS